MHITQAFTSANHWLEAELSMAAGAQQNSTACLEAGTCQPLGGFNVWAAVPPLRFNQTSGWVRCCAVNAANSKGSAGRADAVVHDQAASRHRHTRTATDTQLLHSPVQEEKLFWDSFFREAGSVRFLHLHQSAQLSLDQSSQLHVPDTSGYL